MKLHILRMHITLCRILVVCRVLCAKVVGATSSEGFLVLCKNTPYSVHCYDLCAVINCQCSAFLSDQL